MATTNVNQPFLIRLPNEIFFAICWYLDVQHLTALAQTCRIASQLTQDKAIWLEILCAYQRRLPLPIQLRRPLLELNSSGEDLKSIVLLIRREAFAWFQPKQAVRLHRATSAGQVVALELFLDRWLLSIHVKGEVLLWDISRVAPEAKPIPTRLLNHETRGIWHVAAFDKDTHSIILVMSATHGLTYTRIYRIPLPKSGDPSPPGPAEYIRGIETEVNHKPKMVDVSNSCVAFSRPGKIDVVYWGGDGPQTSLHAVDMDMVSLSTESTPFEDLFDSINAIRVMGPYIISFKIRSIEIYPLRLRKSDPGHLLHKQPFSFISFRDILLSDNEVAYLKDNHPFDSTISFSFMAYDVLEGLFRFEVSIQASSDYSVTPMVELTLMGIYPLTNSINAITPPLSAHSSFFSQSSPLSSPNREAPTPTPSQIPRNRGTSAARGFISTYALGSQGRRAMWVERSRGSTTRDFVVWGKHLEEVEEGEAIEMEKKVVHTISSQDMRDDVTCCAFGESSSRIAYANQAGQIYVIPATDTWHALERLCDRLTENKEDDEASTSP